LVKELKAIQAAATKEKATETAGRIEKLIGKRQATFRGRMEELKVRRQRAQRIARQRAGQSQRPRRRGRQVPNVELRSFDGKTIKLAEHKDEIVVLEWFNLECPFSIYHHETKSTMADLARKYKDKGVVWLAVNSTNTTTAEANVAFAKKQKLPYPIIDDRSGRVGRAFGARTTPHVIVINKGTIVYDGAIDNAPMGKVQGGGEPINFVDDVLSKLTSGKEASLSSTKPYGCSVKYKQ
jgi:peroxiredoxin